MKLYIVYLMLLIFLIPSAISQETTYTKIGDTEGDFVRGVGIFNTELGTSDTTGNVVVSSNKKWHPLIADLDGDGDNEYVIIDGDEIRIFEDNTLDLVDAFGITIGSSVVDAERYSNPLAFDIDGDGKVEIIYVREKSAFLDIIEFNGSEIFAQASINLSTLSSSDIGSASSSEYAIICQDTNKCMMTYANEDAGGSTVTPRVKQWFGAFFNSTFAGHEKTFLDLPAGRKLLCHSRTRSMAIADYDRDGIDEIIFTIMEIDAGVIEDSMHIFWVQLEDNGTIEIDNTFEETDDIGIAYRGDSNVNRCDGTGAINVITQTPPSIGENSIQQLYTNPITFDFDGAGSNGLETMVGFVKEGDGNHYDFLIKAYDGCSSDLGFEVGCSITEKDDFPETCDLLGNCGSAHALTNIYRTNAFPDASGGNVDVCVSGVLFPTPNNVGGVDTICASLQKTVPVLGLFDSSTMEIVLDISDIPFNTSIEFAVQNGNVNNIWHSAQHSSEPTNGQNLNEVITPYGIMRIKDGATSSPDWEIIFANPESTDGTMISADGEFDNSEDLLLYTGGNLFYIDDGLSNQGGFIANISFNPCPIDAILKINTTLEIDVVIQDNNPLPLSQDPVTARVSVYNGDPNELNDLPVEFNNVSSGALLPYSFNLNKTITNGEILIEGFDSVNPDDIDTQEFILNVQNNGIEFGQSDCSIGFVVAPPTVPVIGILNITSGALANEGIIGFVEGGSNQFKVSPLVFVLILMLAYTIAVFTTKDKTNDSMITMNKVIFMIVGNAFIFIIGTIIGAISFGIMLVIIILAIFSVVLWARRQFTANQM